MIDENDIGKTIPLEPGETLPKLTAKEKKEILAQMMTLTMTDPETGYQELHFNKMYYELKKDKEFYVLTRRKTDEKGQEKKRRKKGGKGV